MGPFLIHSLAHPLISWACQHASTLLTLLVANSKYCSAKGKQKMVTTIVILSFCSETHFKTYHWSHGSLANINLLFLSSPNSDPLFFLPLHIERSHIVKIRSQKVRYCCIFCFYHKKSFIYHTNCHWLWFVTFQIKLIY